MTSALYSLYDLYAGPAAMQQRHGFLLPIDAQTGIGKTYQSERLMLAHLIENSGKTIIYATNLRSNVAEAFQNVQQLIRSHADLKKEEKEQLLQQVILLPSQEDSINQLDAMQKKELLAHIDSIYRPELSQLFLQIDFLKNNNIAKSLFYDSILHREAYSLLRRGYKNYSGTLPESVNAVFPANLIKPNGTQVLFMTTAKLLHPWHTSHSTYRFSDFLANSLLILDEFDRQQAEVLRHLLQNESDFDSIVLLRRLYASFTSLKIKQSEDFKDVETCFHSFRLALNEFHQTWYLQLRPVLAHNSSTANPRIFTLLSDRLSLNAINFKVDQLQSTINMAHSTHHIGASGKLNTLEFVNHGHSVLRKFCNALLKAVDQISKNIDIKEYKPATNEKIVSKALNAVGLEDLHPIMMQLLVTRLGTGSKRNKNNYSFHSNGFELINITQTTSIDDTAMAKTFDLAFSASGLIANWVKGGAKIMGLSATANSRTAIHNFDLNYLKNTLGDQFICLTDKQVNSIQTEYNNKRRYTENQVSIHTQAISAHVDWGGLEGLYLEWNSNDTHPLLLEEKLCDMLNSEPYKLQFDIARVNKMLGSIRIFAAHPHNRYHFCMLNKSFTHSEFSKFISWYAKKLNIIIFANINAKAFRDNSFNQVIHHLENSTKKVVVITNYQATGAGLSPSYKLKQTKNYIYVGEPKHKQRPAYTDIDSIYLEQPTNLIGNQVLEGQSSQERAFAIKKNIHDILMLHDTGVIPAVLAKDKIQNFISVGTNPSVLRTLQSTYKNSIDYRYAIYRFIEQALGRMCRTEWKQAEINIMFDAETNFLQTLAQDPRDLNGLSLEYKALIKAVNRHYQAQVLAPKTDSYHAQASRNYVHIQRLITSVYKYQNPSAIKKYHYLADFILKQPRLLILPQTDEQRYYFYQPDNSGYRYKINAYNEQHVLSIDINPTDIDLTPKLIPVVR